MIRLHALHRRSAGTNALVVLRDTRWEDSQQIIRTMEIDLSAKTQLVYMFPDIVLSIDNFNNHVEVAIKTHGYDTCVDNVVDHLTTTGITAIPSERRSVEELEGMTKRSNKPKLSKRRSWEKWSTLGEPFRKWDYYVKYDAPRNITPIKENAATGWGDEFSEDEATTGKVTILNESEEQSDWDDDERSGREIIVIQEKLAQNQQDFLDDTTMG
ncbi:hypothetical protein Tco_1337736 [Tanacetum coccineum]